MIDRAMIEKRPASITDEDGRRILKELAAKTAGEMKPTFPAAWPIPFIEHNRRHRAALSGVLGESPCSSLEWQLRASGVHHRCSNRRRDPKPALQEPRKRQISKGYWRQLTQHPHRVACSWCMPGERLNGFAKRFGERPR